MVNNTKHKQYTFNIKVNKSASQTLGMGHWDIFRLIFINKT